MKKTVAFSGIMTAFVVITLVSVAAQQAGFRRTLLQQADLSIPGREAVTALAELDPGAQSGRHTHPGEEIAYIAQGPVVLEVEGKPARTMQTGEAVTIPSGAIHNVRNTGSATAKVVANYVVEKGKPVATPVQ